MRHDLASAFHERMLQLHEETLAQCPGYPPECLRHRLDEIGGVELARRLVGADNAPPGFVRLWEMGRLDLSVEAEILRPDWDGLFDADLRERARARLERFGWEPCPVG